MKTILKSEAMAAIEYTTWLVAAHRSQKRPAPKYLVEALAVLGRCVGADETELTDEDAGAVVDVLAPAIADDSAPRTAGLDHEGVWRFSISRNATGKPKRRSQKRVSDDLTPRRSARRRGN